MSFDPSRLKSILLGTGLQQKDNRLYQFLNQLIDALSSLNTQTSSINSSSSVTNITNIIQQLALSESGEDGMDGIGIIGPQGPKGDPGTGSNGYWSVLTDGDFVEENPIEANGDEVMVFVPTP